jgi:hypothetical protein
MSGPRARPGPRQRRVGWRATSRPTASA